MDDQGRSERSKAGREAAIGRRLFEKDGTLSTVESLAPNAARHSAAPPRAGSTSDSFVRRHIGPSDQDVDQMLRTVGASSLDELIEQTIPQQIRLPRGLSIGPEKSE